MGIALNQNLVEKKEKQESWSFKKLFEKITPLQRVFHNPFLPCLFLSIACAGVAEISGQRVSFEFYLIILMLDVSTIVVHLDPQIKKEQKPLSITKKNHA